jgi:NAD-dependent dihydropyrimidine dehydrogenase PreA subunit
MKTKIQIEKEHCLGTKKCGKCISLCPYNNLAAGKDGHPQVKDEKICHGQCHDDHQNLKPCKKGCYIGRKTACVPGKDAIVVVTIHKDSCAI